MTFKELRLSDGVLNTLAKLGHDTPTAIQEEAIPHILKGKDVLGCAQTGTGKTAAFVLPIIEALIKHERVGFPKVKVLILSPTRELAVQTRDNFRKYGTHTDIRCGVILGGVNQRSQEEVIKKGLDVIVATPGRLLDLINQRIVKLGAIEILVLDEADTMLDMGFIHDIKKIVEMVPKPRQTLMFSATMPNSIRTLANEFLTEPVIIEANHSSLTVDKINQVLYYVEKKDKASLLLELINKEENKSTLVFTRTKHGANRLAETLEKSNFYCEVIHGNKAQSARTRALTNFKTGKSKVLIATDVAARGIDINELSLVVNYEIPETPEAYVHRIGRTGRAGCTGTAITLCDLSEKRRLGNIENLIKQKITVIEEHNYKIIPQKQRDNKDNYSRNKEKSSSFKPKDKTSESKTNSSNSDSRRADQNSSSYKPDYKKPETKNNSFNRDNRRTDSKSSSYKPDYKKPETKNNNFNRDNRNTDSKSSSYKPDYKKSETRTNNFNSDRKRSETRNRYSNKKAA